MLALTKRLVKPQRCLDLTQIQQLRTVVTDQQRSRRRPKFRATTMKTADEKSEWWVIDGEMHEIGDNVPIRERFVVPRDNIPNRRRKQLRDQFMRRTRLVVKDHEHEPFCKKYMQLYNELRENWERLYWDEGYSKKLAVDHANYDSPEEDDDEDFSPYRRGRSNSGELQEQGQMRSGRAEVWKNVSQIRDKFEYDRERRMRDKAFAPMNMGNTRDDRGPTFKNQPFDAEEYLSSGDDED